jgi:hypothetical protein
MLAMLLAGCSPGPDGSLDTSALEGLPYVAQVRSPIQSSPAKHQIIHILGWHLVSEEAFTADLLSQGIEDGEIAGHYEVDPKNWARC